RLSPSDRHLGMELEVFHAVRERSADPGFEAGVIVGDVAASREPRAEEPLERAEFEIDTAAYFNLCDGHGWKSKPADLTLGCESLGFDGRVIPALFQRHEFGILPLVAEPLTIGQRVTLGPGHQAVDSIDDGGAFVWVGHADVGDGS